MAELQIASIQIHKDDLSNYDTGGATREVNASITVDCTLPVERQRECLIHEILGIYLGSILDVGIIEQIAGSISEAIIDLEVLNG